MVELGGQSEHRARTRRWPMVLVGMLALALGAWPTATTVYGQPFQPQPPAEAPHRQEACRPSAPAVEKTPGVSVRIDRGPAECKSVSLSFDAGADRGYAEQILD